MRLNRRFILVASLALLGVLAGAGAMAKVLYNRTGKQFLWSIDRKLESKIGLRAFTSSNETWHGGQTIPVRIEVVRRGLDGPTRIVFSHRDATDDAVPFYYIGEIGGSIRVVKKDGSMSTFTKG